MKGLIKKDLLILKNNIKSLVLLLFIYIACSLNSDGIEAFIVPFMIAMLCVSTFNYDEYNKWDAYALTLPGTRHSVVKAKYTVSLILIGLSSLAAIIMSFIIGTIRGNYDFENAMIYTLVGMATGLLIISIIYPLIIKLGLEKGRIGIMLASFGFSALIAVLSKTVKIPTGTVILIERLLPLLLPVLAVSFLLISYIISKRIYIKKEF